MKSFRKSEPEHELQLPPHAPEAVAEAQATFEQIANDWRDARSALAEAIELSKVDLATATREAAEARVSRTKPKRDREPARVQAAHELKVAEANADVVVLGQAMDKAGDALVDAVDAARGEWLETLDAAEAVAVERLKKALADARSAVNDLGPARAAPAWVREFSVAYAKRGEQSGCPHGTVTVDASYNRMDSFTDANRVLDLLAQAVEPPTPKRQARKHSVTVVR